MRQPQMIAMDIANAIPGCSADRAALQAGVAITMRVMGWGTSLHRVGLVWAATPVAMDEDVITAAFEPYVTTQQRRIALARSLGMSDIQQPPPEDLSHLVVDRLSLAFDDTLRDDAIRDIGRFMHLSRPGREEISRYGDTTVASSGALPGDDDPDPRPRLLQQAPTDCGKYDGRNLIIHHNLPETVLAAMAGRRLGDVADMGDQLEPELEGLLDRIIIGAASCNQGIRITTKPEWTAIT